jgi:polar amino acid transport system substrate-binding protein
MKPLKLFIGLMIFSVLLSVNVTTVEAKEWKKVVIATEGGYPPFNNVNAAGEIIGFDVELGNALCKQMGVECEFVVQEWDGIIPSLNAGKYDAVIASMYITEERMEKVAFTRPYFMAAMSMVGSKSANITDVSSEALKGKVIGAQRGTTQSEYIELMYKDVAEIRLYAKQDQVNLDMANGRLDLQAGDLAPLIEWVNNGDDGKCCEIVGEPITDSKYVGYGAGITIRKSDNDLREMFNSALETLVSNGTHKKISDKYFPEYLHPFYVTLFNSSK